jgi:hypothetical protein
MRALLSAWVLAIFILTGAAPPAFTIVPNLLEYGSNQDLSSFEQEDDSLRPARLRTAGRSRRNKAAWKSMTSPCSANAFDSSSAGVPLQLTAISRPNLHPLDRLLRI